MTTNDEMIAFISRATKGSKDLGGNEIVRIYSRSRDYVIYEINTDIPSARIKSTLASADPVRDRELEKYYDDVRMKFVELKGKLYKVANDSSVPMRAAQILSHAFMGNAASANSQFDKLMKEIDREFRMRFVHRICLLISTMALPILLCTGYWQISALLPKEDPGHLHWLDFVIFSCCGGFLSVSYRMAKFEFIDEAPTYSYFVLGIERSIVAGLSGLIILFAIRGNLFLGFVDSSNYYIQLLFAIVAGFSESLVPTILNDLEKKSGESLSA